MLLAKIFTSLASFHASYLTAPTAAILYFSMATFQIIPLLYTPPLAFSLFCLAFVNRYFPLLRASDIQNVASCCSFTKLLQEE